MFRPRTLKEEINLARIKDKQLTRQKKLLRPTFSSRAPSIPSTTNKNTLAVPYKTLTWEEMQSQRVALIFQLRQKIYGRS